MSTPFPQPTVVIGGLTGIAIAMYRTRCSTQVKGARDPQLRAKLTPRYGFGCKRPAFSNEYHRAFRRDNVDLVTDSIAEITANGIRTVDDTHRETTLLC